MARNLLVTLGVFLFGAGFVHAAAQQKPAKGGYVIEHDADVAKQQPGPHDGGGQTIGYSFFSAVPKLSLVFRKRILRPGSGIGYHEQTEDEIYYFLSGRGVMTLDGKNVERRARHRGVDAHRQLARPQVSRERGPRHHHQLPIPAVERRRLARRRLPIAARVVGWSLLDD